MVYYILRNAKKYLYQMSKLVPKKARRPFYSLAMVISAYLFLLFMMNVTKSTYLYQMYNQLLKLYYFFWNMGKEKFVFSVLGLLCLFSYFVYRSYETFTAILFFVYCAILIAGILPFLIA